MLLINVSKLGVSLRTALLAVPVWCDSFYTTSQFFAWDVFLDEMYCPLQAKIFRGFMSR